MELTDAQLLKLIAAGYSDAEIKQFVHLNSTPSDLYKKIAEAVVSLLHQEASLMEIVKQKKTLKAVKVFLAKINDTPLLKEVADWWLELGITRSDTKNIVMTYLYGSTPYGNREGIRERIVNRSHEILEKQLDPYFDNLGNDTWRERRNNAITLMVTLSRGAMGIHCESTVKTMELLKEWGEALGSQDIPFKCKNPLGFVMYQVNKNLAKKSVYIYENGKKKMQLFYREPAKTGKKLNGRKMGAGIAPNVTHSHDAAHLQLTVCNTDSKYFHMIHDSYATQAADTPELASATSKSFQEIYENDVIYDLWCLNRGEERGLREPEEVGELDLEEVSQSKYFFS